jgi:DMSO/TMAO reductase YedYZ molybdopterin-dependent catalytic subunit
VAGGVGSGPTTEPLTFEELQLAGRNRGMPLEALQYDITPTGLHYLLIHFDIPALHEDAWQLRIHGAVHNELSLSLDDIRGLPRRSLTVTMECAGNGRARLTPRPLSQPWLVEAIGTARWSGAALRDVISAAGLADDALELVFSGADRGIQGEVEHSYERSLTIDEAMRDDVLLAYEMNGQLLESQHGYPLRLIVPGWYGMTSVKWLTSIRAVREPFDGFQQATAYHFKNTEDDPGTPVTRIRPRALMVPPGIPDFFTRRRLVDAGRVTLIGRAWSGQGRIERVEVGLDGAWHEATLGAPLGDYAWQAWSFDWDAAPGDHQLSCRATDGAGNTQPIEQPWNWQGMGNNMAQVVPVTVRS